jgi:transposase
MNSKVHFIRTKEDSWRNCREKQTSKDKIDYVREVIRKELVVNDLYGRESIDTKLFDKCTRDFIETEKGRFVHNVKSEVTTFEINHLKNQNILLKQLIAELSHENFLLKEKLLKEGNDKVSFE